MPPNSRSRYLASLGVKNSDGVLFLTERKPFRYDPRLKGTRTYITGDKDKLQVIAYKFFSPIPNAEHLWWIIAEFQPIPIFDLTLDIPAGRTLYIPSNRVVQERILGH